MLLVCDVWTPPKIYNLLLNAVIYDINILVMNREHLLHLALCTRLFWADLNDKQHCREQFAWHAEECKWDFGTSDKLLWYDSRNSALRHIQLLLVPIYGTVMLFISSTWLHALYHCVPESKCWLSATFLAPLWKCKASPLKWTTVFIFAVLHWLILQLTVSQTVVRQGKDKVVHVVN